MSQHLSAVSVNVTFSSECHCRDMTIGGLDRRTRILSSIGLAN
ncbi:MAG: hypothetical protein OXT74_09355 [Candidatus Poribacteria bacterium]|nr:hypothetical protein [Candidatus Poribacteria bacterium]